MQKLAEICIRRPVFATMIILALVVVGAATYVPPRRRSLPVGRPAHRHRPRRACPAPRPRRWRPRSRRRSRRRQHRRGHRGAALHLRPGQRHRHRHLQPRAATSTSRPRTCATASPSPSRNLPRDIRPPVISKFDNDQRAGAHIALSGDRSHARADRARRQDRAGPARALHRRRRGATSWAACSARSTSGSTPIGWRPTRSRSPRCATPCVRQNAELPGGNVDAPAAARQSLRTMGRFATPRAFNDLVVATLNGAPVRVRDIGYAEDGTKEQRSLARLNGVPTVTLEVRRQSGANTVAVIEGAQGEARARRRRSCPPDVKLEVIRDQSRYIYAALHEINLHLILGSILASLVVLAFMRIAGARRSSPAVAIPTSVISTFGMMWALGFTLNSVTMLALVLMVGIVIDDAIVVLENIFRFVEEKKMGAFEAARAATAEIGLAVLATTLLAGRDLRAGLVHVLDLRALPLPVRHHRGGGGAGVACWSRFTLTPMMSARLLRTEDATAARTRATAARPPRAAASTPGSTAATRGSLRARHGAPARWSLVCLGVVALASIRSALSPGASRSTSPATSTRRSSRCSVTGPEGTSLAAMDEAMRAVEKEIRRMRRASQRARLRPAAASSAGVNQGNIFVRIAPHEERTFSLRRLWDGLRPRRSAGAPSAATTAQRDVMIELRAALRASSATSALHGAQHRRRFNIGGGNFDIDFALRGPELETLVRATPSSLAREGPGAWPASSTPTPRCKLDKPELRVVSRPRPRRRPGRGHLADIATALRLMVGGDDQVSRFRDPSDQRRLRRAAPPDGRVPQRPRHDLAAVRLARLASTPPHRRGRPGRMAPAGGLVRLDNLVRIERTPTASRIDRTRPAARSALCAPASRPATRLADRLTALRRRWTR